MTVIIQSLVLLLAPFLYSLYPISSLTISKHQHFMSLLVIIVYLVGIALILTIMILSIRVLLLAIRALKKHLQS